MRSAALILGFVLSACGSDDPINIVPTDAGVVRDHQRPGHGVDAGPDDRPSRRDVGLTIPDGGFDDETDGGNEDPDGGGPPFDEDAGREPSRDGGVRPGHDGGQAGPGNDPVRRTRLLQQRQFICDGEQLSTASFTWSDRRLTGMQLNEMDFPVFDWTIEHENGRPSRARSNLEGWSLEARWTYTGEQLTSAFMGDPDESIEWRFEYDDSDRPVIMTVTEDFEGQLSEQRAEARWGIDGPEDFFGTSLSYADGRPNEVNDLLPVLYDDNEILQGVGGGSFALRYGPDGALAELDLLDGCLYRFTWAPGEPVHYRGSLGLGDFAMLYDVEGRYAGDFDPARELYLVILLLLGE